MKMPIRKLNCTQWFYNLHYRSCWKDWVRSKLWWQFMNRLVIYDHQPKQISVTTKYDNFPEYLSTAHFDLATHGFNNAREFYRTMATPDFYCDVVFCEIYYWGNERLLYAHEWSTLTFRTYRPDYCVNFKQLLRNAISMNDRPKNLEPDQRWHRTPIMLWPDWYLMRKRR